MKCHIKRVTALVLALMLIISFAACGCEREPSIVGKWNYELSLKDFIENVVQLNKDSFDQSIQVVYDEMIKAFDKYSIKVILELKDDGTFSFAPDVDAAIAAVDKVKEKLESVITKALKLIGFSEEQIKAKINSMDDIMNGIIGEINRLDYSGKYVYEDKKLYLFDEGKEKNNSQYLDIELDNNEFTVTKINGDVKGFQGMDALLPMTFKRA